jgi:phage terminase small subunit
MGRRGPQPAPVAIQELRGARESRINRDAPQVGPGLPVKPADMIEGASAIWDRLMAALGPTGAITRADGEAVRGAAEAVAVHHQLVAVYKATGEKAVIRNRAGEIVINPILREILRAQASAQVACREIGATPSSRGTIRAPRSASSDPFDAFLRTTPKGPTHAS